MMRFEDTFSNVAAHIHVNFLLYRHKMTYFNVAQFESTFGTHVMNTYLFLFWLPIASFNYSYISIVD